MPTPDEVDFLFEMTSNPVFAAERAKRAAAFDPTRAWVDGSRYRLSDRVWQGKQWSRDQIDQLLQHAIATGEDALVTAKKLEQFLDPAYAPIRTTKGRLVRNQRRAIVTQAPGRGGSGSFPARRLARTEITRAHGQGTIDAATRTPFAQGVKWNLSGRHPKADICDANARHDEGLGPGVWPTDNVPPYPEHPQDLCTLSVAVLDDVDAVVDALRDQYGLGPPVGAAPTPQPRAFPEPGAFADLTEAEAWANQAYPHITWDFAGAHIDTINPTLAQFHKLAGEWPEVAGRLTHVGTYQGKMKGLTKAFEGSQSRAFAHAYMTKGDIIGLNPKYYGNPALMKKSLRETWADGWLADKDDPASLMTHEFGHMVDAWLQATSASLVPVVPVSGDGLVAELWRGFRGGNFRVNTNDRLSRYSRTNAEETMAEAFSYRYHPGDREPTRAFLRQNAVLDFIQERKAHGQWYETTSDWQWTSDLPRDQRTGAVDEADQAKADWAKAVKDAEARWRRQQKKAIP